MVVANQYIATNKLANSRQEADMPGTIKIKVPELLKAQGKSASDLMYGARLAPATAYRLADGRADGISFSVLANLCAYFGVGVDEILEYTPEAESNKGV